MGEENNQDPVEDALISALSDMLRALLRTLDEVSDISRHLRPENATGLENRFAPFMEDVNLAHDRFLTQAWPDQLDYMIEAVNGAVAEVRHVNQGLAEIGADPEGVFLAYRALRFQSRALEALYPLSLYMPVLSQFYLEPGAGENKALLARFSPEAIGEKSVGVLQANNDKHERGGFSVYIPEHYSDKNSYPLIVALHGGSGHGRSFLWSWLRNARTHGAILLSPTSMDRTWSLMQPEQDANNIGRMIEMLAGTYNIDRSRMLLTGMSDGGTFTYLYGGNRGAPFTHLAPIAASFQPLLLEFLDKEKLQGLPVYLTHGALDWMFPIDIARTAKTALEAAGVDLVYREISDLSHTYPVEENAEIMKWFLSQERIT